MTLPPDDPRHGTNAGSVAHWRSGERPCGPCRDGALRAKKQRQLDELGRGEPANVPLGAAAHAIIATTNRTILSRGTGIGTNQLRLYLVDGPDRTVRRTTRDKILAFRRPWTPVGIQRRLRALTLLGWSMQALADRTGIYMTSLAELRRNESIKFVRIDIAEKILAAWEDLCMTPAPASHSSRETAARAADRGWVPGLAWDDIDTDPRPPRVPSQGAWEDQVDHAVVRRVIDGGPRPRKLTRAECGEIVAGLLARGFSTHQIENDFGFKVERHRAPERVAS